VARVLRVSMKDATQRKAVSWIDWALLGGLAVFRFRFGHDSRLSHITCELRTMNFELEELP